MTFDLNSYLGKWYEIARINNEFEPEMKNVIAQYSLFESGFIQVINSGYIEGELKQIIGVAKLTDQPGLLKVSFFPGSYSDYKILYIDEDYQYALVGGNSKNYLWILSRIPDINSSVLLQLVNIAKENGYNTDKIIMTKHDNEL